MRLRYRERLRKNTCVQSVPLKNIWLVLTLEKEWNAHSVSLDPIYF
jgi:hypothetical protein